VGEKKYWRKGVPSQNDEQASGGIGTLQKFTGAGRKSGTTTFLKKRRKGYLQVSKKNQKTDRRISFSIRDITGVMVGKDQGHLV